MPSFANNRLGLDLSSKPLEGATPSRELSAVAKVNQQTPFGESPISAKTSSDEPTQQPDVVPIGPPISASDWGV